MRNRFFALATVASVFAVSSVAGCAVDSTGAGEDGLEEEVAGEAEDALSASGNTGYFVVTRRDFRRCVSPLCGGVFVKRVNQATTRCADGTMQAECYVASYDFRATGLDATEAAAFEDTFESSHGLVRATMVSTRFNGQKLGKLRVNEAWKGAGEVDASGGNFYRIADNGIRCITAPCPSQTAFTLNSNQQHNIVKLDIDRVPADRNEVASAQAALGTSQGILVSGGLALPKCPVGVNCGPFVSADEFYLRATHQVGPKVCGGLLGAQCAKGEYCSFAIDAMCGAADQTGVCKTIPTVCTKEYRPVCGCDDKTYGNACMAAAAGTSVVKDGACVTGPTPGTCGTRGGVQCAADEFCAFPAGSQCGATDRGGSCAKRPQACTMVYQPVCGCDGRTYGNACSAANQGVSVASNGECAPR